MFQKFRFLVALVGLLQLMALGPSYGQTSDATTLRGEIARLAGVDFRGVEAVVQSLAETGDPAVTPILRALRGGDVYWLKSDNTVVIGEKAKGRKLNLFDPVSGDAIDTVRKSATKKVKVNNGLRNIIDAAIGGLTLRASDPAVRMKAANPNYS